MVVFMITLIYVGVIGQLALQWYTTKSVFVNNGESRETAFLATYSDDSNVSFWITVVANLCVATVTVLADTLLVGELTLYN